ncbi:unnamed protein product [Adineta ricciae]|uniref:Uncharacterized protein n=1 Tax=Adineta ricciae TaxID=249248 RepID=A0A815YMX3_ADIRI|nr:unnamed protein product [Adineta ricciae]
MTKVHRKFYCLPSDDFVYGIKHPKYDGLTGVAAALQHCEVPTNNVSYLRPVPDFIRINKLAVRLGLTKVSAIHQYRKIMANCPNFRHSCHHTCANRSRIPDIVHGQTTNKQQSIRDVLQQKYLYDRCR